MHDSVTLPLAHPPIGAGNACRWAIFPHGLSENSREVRIDFFA
jgi:hypothetical protein